MFVHHGTLQNVTHSENLLADVVDKSLQSQPASMLLLARAELIMEPSSSPPVGGRAATAKPAAAQ